MKPKLVPQDKSLRKPFVFGILVLLSTSVFCALLWNRLPPEIPIFFSKSRGESQLGNKAFIFLPIFLSLFTLLVNSFFAQFLANHQLLRKIIIFSGTASCILISITVIRVVFLVL